MLFKSMIGGALLLLCGHFALAQDTSSPNAIQYKITCELVDGESNNTTKLPAITVLAGQSATAQVMKQAPFVTDIAERNGAIQPVIEVLSHGIELQILAREANDGKIMLQLKSKISEITDVSEAQLAKVESRTGDRIPTIQCPKHETHTVRATHVVESGGTLNWSASDTKTLELRIERLSK